MAAAEEAKIAYGKVRALFDEDASIDTVKKAIKMMIQIVELDPKPKYQKKLESLKEALVEMENESSSPEDHSIDDLASQFARQTIEAENKNPRYTKVGGHKILKKPYEKLYNYQKEGLTWLLNRFDQETKRGCVLADDMGLGKTIQTIVFLASLLEEDSINSVLIIAPNSLLQNWAKEFREWCYDINVYKYHEGTKKQRLENLMAVQRRGGILLTTYGLLQNHCKTLCSIDGDEHEEEFVWDVIVLDEAHKIKNTCKTTNAARSLLAKFRLAITGTPVMNKLEELYNIFAFLMDKELLPNAAEFKRIFKTPIERSRTKGAAPREVSEGIIRSEQLHGLVDPYILRRTKDVIFSPTSECKITLPNKHDWIIWVKMSPDQVTMYRDFLETKEVKQLIRRMKDEPKNKKGVLMKLTSLKRLCDHPLLFPLNGVIDLLQKVEGAENNDNHIANSLIDVKEFEGQEHENDEEKEFTYELVRIADVSVSDLKKWSAKIPILLDILRKHREEGNRTLVFSQSTRMLDIIQKVLESENFELARLDGSVKMKDRDEIVNTFQRSTKINVMLLTTQVGGVGLTLTNADRVVVVDPAWNPAIDIQAIDRAYRIGQDKPVIVYRLITCGSVEEKIFRRQVYKGAIIRQMMKDGDDEDPTRYFSEMELRELFKFTTSDHSETCIQLHSMHKESAAVEDVECHKNYVANIPDVFGISNHQLLFSVKNKESDRATEFEEEEILTRMSEINLGPMVPLGRAHHWPVAVTNDVRKRNVLPPGLPNPTKIDPAVITIDHSPVGKLYSDPTDVIDLVESPLKVERSSIVSIPNQSINLDDSTMILSPEAKSSSIVSACTSSVKSENNASPSLNKSYTPDESKTSCQSILSEKDTKNVSKHPSLMKVNKEENSIIPESDDEASVKNGENSLQEHSEQSSLRLSSGSLEKSGEIQSPEIRSKYSMISEDSPSDKSHSKESLTSEDLSVENPPPRASGFSFAGRESINFLPQLQSTQLGIDQYFNESTFAGKTRFLDEDEEYDDEDYGAGDKDYENDADGNDCNADKDHHNYEKEFEESESQFRLHSSYLKTPTPTKMEYTRNSYMGDGSWTGAYQTPPSVTIRSNRESKPQQSEPSIVEETSFGSEYLNLPSQSNILLSDDDEPAVVEKTSFHSEYLNSPSQSNILFSDDDEDVAGGAISPEL